MTTIEEGKRYVCANGVVTPPMNRTSMVLKNAFYYILPDGRYEFYAEDGTCLTACGNGKDTLAVYEPVNELEINHLT